MMKRYFILFLTLWIILFTIPFFTLDRAEEAQADVPMSTDGTEAEAASSAGAVDTIDSHTMITLLDENSEVIELALDEYLAGVVAAEMPALFPDEALKAQAVAARTYSMNKLAGSAPPEHKGAALCCDPSHCKAYKPLSAMAVNWGISSQVYTDKIKNAVFITDGEILLYDDQPISAVFHSTSSGKTERAADVWGKDVPYLQSVKSTGEEESPRFSSRVELSPGEFSEKFKKLYINADFSSNPANWFSDINRSSAGGVKTISVGGVPTTGNIIRNLCGLSSTNFAVSASADKIVFETKGYGHGVGMSQYGARALAEQGKSYREILSLYYTGVEFGKIKLND